MRRETKGRKSRAKNERRKQKGSRKDSETVRWTDIKKDKRTEKRKTETAKKTNKHRTKEKRKTVGASD